MGNKVLILCNTNVFPSRLFEQRGVDFHQYFNAEISFSAKILRRLTLSVGFFRRNFWYGKWFYQLGRYDTILLFAINDIKDVIKDVEKFTKSGQRKIIYFWDPVFRISECLEYPFEKWSFDVQDCSKYNLIYNSTFYFKQIVSDVQSAVKLDYNSVYFIGLDKGRRKLISEIQETLKLMDIHTHFIVFDDNVKERITFEENLKNISASNAILDLSQQNQSGLTVRVMESIFLAKKLITNNSLIREQAFYHPDNIFIIGNDVMSDLKTFLLKPYNKKHVESFQDYFDFDNWMRRFEV
jgi:hypothetical protein